MYGYSEEIQCHTHAHISGRGDKDKAGHPYSYVRFFMRSRRLRLEVYLKEAFMVSDNYYIPVHH